MAGMRQLGLPDCFVNAWSSYLDGLRRRFRISGLLGEEHTTVNGFPEGCCLSVVAMLVTAWSYTVEVEDKAAVPDHKHLMESQVFADNFEVIGNDQNAIACTVEATFGWAEPFRVILSQEKSYYWSTDDDVEVLEGTCL